MKDQDGNHGVTRWIMSIFDDGQRGESYGLKWLKQYNFKPIMQADWIFKFNHTDYGLLEVKHKEVFTADEKYPVTGHGLPYYQIKNRLAFYHNFGIRPLLLIFDSNDFDIYWQYLDLLEKNAKVQNKDYLYLPNKKIKIYNLGLFNREPMQELIKNKIELIRPPIGMPPREITLVDYR